MSTSRSIRATVGLALLVTVGILPGCGGAEQASAPPQVSTPPPAVSADAQKKYEKEVPNEGMSSSSGVDSTLQQ